MTQFTPPPLGMSLPYSPAPSKTSGLAIASLVLSILGFCTAGLTGLVGINKSAGRNSGSGLAISGIIVGALSMLCLPLQIGLLLPALTKARDAARTEAQHVRAATSLKQVYLAFDFYANDNHNFLPP